MFDLLANGFWATSIANGSNIMSTSFRVSLIALTASALLVAGSAVSQADDLKAPRAPQTQCPSKWVAAGNNGAKADRYYRPHCD